MRARVVTIDLTEIRLWLRVMVTPGCWLQNEPLDREWDRKLRALLAEHDFTEICTHDARLGPEVLWTSNHPYSSMLRYKDARTVRYADSLYHTGVSVRGRPTRRTILYAGDRLDAASRMSGSTIKGAA